ncbi:50S ribosome-binding GTPase [Rhizoctonia solani]|uniref:50S ribosome-binding GTPase n=1 Tax=Rhizoctonia solani TaxID=456999 RepID=A0A8H7M6I7_9AGAM|nr:50S ribosome-binding GTPase [Rhizoctonia solani]
MIDFNNGLHEAAIIVLFGPTGAGKTTFANVASGDSMRIGRGVKSCTQNVEPTTMFTVDGKPVVVVDCPGFDDTYLSETDILKSVAGFLTAAYSQQFKITGLLYLHRITDTRVGGTDMRHLNMFKELCGTDSLQNVVYVTNMWSNPPTEDEMFRENALRDGIDLFGGPLALGAQMARHYNTQESAHDIIRLLLPREPTMPKIAKEIKDENRKLEETAAGIALGHGLQDEIKKLNEQIKRIQEEHAREKVARERHQSMEKMLKAQEQRAQEKQQSLLNQVKALGEGHQQKEEVWRDQLQAHSAAMAQKMSEAMLRLNSDHEAKEANEKREDKMREEFRKIKDDDDRKAQLAQKAFNEALADARRSNKRGICVIA